MDPAHDLTRLAAELAHAPSATARLAYADALARVGREDEALEVLQAGLEEPDVRARLAAWPAWSGDPWPATGSRTIEVAVAATTPVLRWSWLGLPARGRPVANPLAVVVSETKRALVLDPRTGKQRHRLPAGQPVLDRDALVLLRRERVRAWDVWTKEPLWERSLRGGYNHFCALGAGLLFATRGQGLRAFLLAGRARPEPAWELMPRGRLYVAAAPPGALWLAFESDAGERQLWQVHPPSGKILHRIPWDQTPIEVADAAGFVSGLRLHAPDGTVLRTWEGPLPLRTRLDALTPTHVWVRVEEPRDPSHAHRFKVFAWERATGAVRELACVEHETAEVVAVARGVGLLRAASPIAGDPPTGVTQALDIERGLLWELADDGRPRQLIPIAGGLLRADSLQVEGWGTRPSNLPGNPGRIRT